MQDELDLFPLQLVLFPGSFVPLHIYEERYKALIHSCQDAAVPFGVNLVQGQEMCAVGCTARVVDVLQTYPDGRMDIVVSGGRRFRILSLEEPPTGCIHAQVEYFDDVPEAAVNTDVFAECVDMYNHIVEIAFQGEHQLSLQLQQTRPGGFSYLMAQKVGLQIAQKQLLLESQSENERLLLLHRHMKELLPNLQESAAKHSVVRLDGYVQRGETL